MAAWNPSGDRIQDRIPKGLDTGSSEDEDEDWISE